MSYWQTVIITDPNFKKDFHSVFDPIEKLSVPLNYAWKTAKNLNYVKSTDGYRTAFQRVKTISHTVFDLISEHALFSGHPPFLFPFFFF